MAEAKLLRCNKCGARPTPEEAKYTARLGGTHYLKRAHRFDASKHGQPTIRVVSCGTWVEQEASPQ